MSTLRVYIFAADPTSSNPVTGLTLTDFEVDIYRVTKGTGVASQIVSNAALTKEIGEGFYLYQLGSLDELTYDYFDTVNYTGVTALDNTLWSDTDASTGVTTYASLLTVDVFASLTNAAVTGLALTDFEVDVFQITKSDNYVTQLYTAADMTAEVGDGHYVYYLADCDFVTNDYLVLVQYEGVTVLDGTVWTAHPLGDLPSESACSPSYRRELPRTLLPLDRFAQIIGLDPRHFRQVTVDSIKTNTSCAKVWKQYSWQEVDSVGRYDVAEAINQAEQAIAEYLNFKLLPTWEYYERHRAPKPDNAELIYSSTYATDGARLAVKANWGHFIEAGIETKTEIEADVAITYTDEDSDGYYETATVQVTTTVTDEEEICVFYPCESGDDRWEIRPLRSVSISGGAATIKMWREQLVQPDLVEAIVPEAVAGLTDANFLTTVDVYRRYNDPTTSATLVWNPSLFNCSVCGSDTTCCPTCGQTTQGACLVGKDYERGLLSYRPASYSGGEWTGATCLTCGRNPDQIIIYYRAGLQDQSRTWPTKQMSPQWERAVAFYALTLLDRPICDCAPIKGISEKWRADLVTGGRATNDDILNNPFGTTRAARLVWNMVREQQQAKAVAW